MTTKTRVALFIDAENASAKHLPDYLKLCRQLGKPTIARCYGGAAGLKKWEKVMAENHIMPMLTPPSANKQNASDFAFTIDAVSLLHRGLFDHAIIASSDADFMQLAIHIREYGKGIDGIGESKATKPLQLAFDTYTFVPATPERKATAAKAPPAVAKRPPTPPAATIDTASLKQIYRELSAKGKTVTPQAFGIALSAKVPNYKKGHRTLDNFLRKSGAFKIENGLVLPLG